MNLPQQYETILMQQFDLLRKIDGGCDIESEFIRQYGINAQTLRHLDETIQAQSKGRLTIKRGFYYE